ncbi:hypothetical protein IG631_23979 [Alternaria alternata]|nr:hypothetical protein IG631_23979 [Alternaria alternata]
MSRYNTVLRNQTSLYETFYNYVSRSSALEITALIVSPGGCGFWTSRHFLLTKCWVECWTRRDYGPMNACHVSYNAQYYGAIQIRASGTGILEWSS